MEKTIVDKESEESDFATASEHYSKKAPKLPFSYFKIKKITSAQSVVPSEPAASPSTDELAILSPHQLHHSMYSTMYYGKTLNYTATLILILSLRLKNK